MHMPMSKQWSTDAELQARWQSGLGSKNMFDEQLLLSYRQWVHYKINNRFRLSFSPFAYFNAYPFITKPGDEALTSSIEYRLAIAAEYMVQVSDKLLLNSRVGAEYRMFEKIDNNWRTRYRIGGKYGIGKKYNVTGNYELLFTTHNRDALSHLDNERVWATVGRNLTTKLKAEIGLMHLRRKINNNQIFVREADILFNITYSLANEN